MIHCTAALRSRVQPCAREDRHAILLTSSSLSSSSFRHIRTARYLRHSPDTLLAISFNLFADPFSSPPTSTQYTLIPQSLFTHSTAAPSPSSTRYSYILVSESAQDVLALPYSQVARNGHVPSCLHSPISMSSRSAPYPLLLSVGIVEVMALSWKRCTGIQS